MRVQLLLRLTPALCLLSLSACKPGDKSAEASSSQEPVSGLSAAGAKAGFAARLPQETEFYAGSTGMKAWGQKLQASETLKVWKNFANEAGGAVATSQAVPLEIEDVFLSLGQGSSQSALWVKSVQEIYNDLSMRNIVASVSGKIDESPLGGMQGFFHTLNQDQDLMLRVVLALEKMNVPPLLAGVKLADPAKHEMELKAKLQTMPGFATLKATELNPEGGHITLLEGTLGIWLTPELREQMMPMVRQMITDKLQADRVEECLTKLAAQKVSFAHGVVDGYMLVGFNVQPKHLEFVSRPIESLAARTDFDFAAKIPGEQLVGLLYSEGRLIKNLVQNQPVSQLLQNVIRAVKANEALGAPLAGLIKEVEPKIEALGAAESKMAAKRKLLTVSGVVSWNDGLHVAVRGGLPVEGTQLDQPRKFGALLDYPDALISSVGVSPVNADGRAIFEATVSTLSAVVLGVAKMGLAGEQGSGIAAMIEQQNLLGSIASVYEGYRGVMDHGFDAEGAFVMDMSGQFPAITPEGGGVRNAGIPRLAWVHAVASRPMVSDNWGKLETSLEGLLKGSPMPLQLPKPVSEAKSGMTTWSYQLTPAPMPDLVPTASLDDKVCAWGTSKTLNEALVAASRQPAAAPLTGAHLRFNFQTLRQWLLQGAQTMSNLPNAGSTPGEMAKASTLFNTFGNLQISAQPSGEVVMWTVDLQVK